MDSLKMNLICKKQSNKDLKYIHFKAEIDKGNH